VQGVKEYTDTEILDYLEGLNECGVYTKRCVLRQSTSGRGWRLHETGRGDAVRSVREAITNKMRILSDQTK